MYIDLCDLYCITDYARECYCGCLRANDCGLLIMLIELPTAWRIHGYFFPVQDSGNGREWLQSASDLRWDEVLSPPNYELWFCFVPSPSTTSINKSSTHPKVWDPYLELHLLWPKDCLVCASCKWLFGVSFSFWALGLALAYFCMLRFTC